MDADSKHRGQHLAARRSIFANHLGVWWFVNLRSIWILIYLDWSWYFGAENLWIWTEIWALHDDLTLKKRETDWSCFATPVAWAIQLYEWWYNNGCSSGVCVFELYFGFAKDIFLLCARCTPQFVLKPPRFGWTFHSPGHVKLPKLLQ